MERPEIWLIRLLLAHLVTDFLMQPSSWIEKRNENHFGSWQLYAHVSITGLVAILFIGWRYWPVGLIILFSHFLIDGWKSYQKQTTTYFLLDQLFHVLIIVGCYYVIFLHPEDIRTAYENVAGDFGFWKTLLAVVFLTTPAGFLIGKMTERWREQIYASERESLAHAGKWIGIIERIIVLILVIKGEYAAIALLIAAKAIIRFNERDRPEIKTEYLVIGTLLSIGIAMITGVLLS
jgi:hypothetical protein